MAQFASIPGMQSNPFSSYFEQFTKTPFQGFQGMPGLQGSHMDTLIEMNGITSRLYSELARQNLKVMNELVQYGVEEMQGLSQARGLDEILSVLSQGAAKASPTVFQHAQRVLDTLLTSASDYNRLFEENMAKTTKAVGKFTERQYQEKTGEKR